MILTPVTRPLLTPYLEKGFHELDFDTYLKTFGASSHGMMDMRRSPKFYKWRRDNQKKTDAMSFGTLVHLIILEPDVLEKRAKVKQKVDGRTKAGKEYNEAFEASVKPTDIVLDTEQKAKLEKMRENLFNHSFAREVIGRPSLKENAGFWIHEDTQVFCKIRPDIAILEGDILVDVKSTVNAHPTVFQKQVYNLMYDMQAAFYLDGYRRITGRQGKFIWLCPETEGALDVACYHATEKIYGFGKVRYEKMIRQFAECFKSDVWHGYANGIVPLDLPGWVESAEQNLEDVEAFVQEHL